MIDWKQKPINIQQNIILEIEIIFWAGIFFYLGNVINIDKHTESQQKMIYYFIGIKIIF